MDEVPFEPVDANVSFPALEQRILEFWREADVFHRQLEQRRDGPLWVFYEGPPTANGRPGVHHVEARTFKDVFPRFKAMTGHYVPRKGGWDCHGLPVELEVEKEIGTKSKRDIEAFGVAEFNRRCRESVQRYVGDFERLTERIGFWIDMPDAYWTMSAEYIESVWWSLKQLHARGLLFQDHRISTYCPRCGTPLSDAEVAMGYEEVEDPSVDVAFRIVEASDPSLVGASMLGWTTTPWTLISNTGVAVNPDATYVLVEHAGDRLIIAEARRDAIAPDDPVVGGPMSGATLVGTRYEPLYPNVRGAHRVVAAGVRLARRRHGRGALGAGVRAGGPRDRQARGVAPVQTTRRRGAVHGRGATPRTRPVLQGRRSHDHRGPAEPGTPRPRGNHPAHLSPVLAMLDAPDLRRQDLLVRPDDRREGPAHGGERGGQLVPRPHQARALRQLAREQRRLGAVARALLGHAPPDLALSRRPRHGDRLARRAVREGWARRHGARPAPPRDRRRVVPMPRVRRDGVTRSRGHRHLVRRGGDAVRAVGLPPGARARPRALRRALPRRLHQRGDRPDARVVLHADGRGRPALRLDLLPQLRVPRPHHG